LTDLHNAEFPDDPRPQQKADQKTSESGINRAKGDIPKYVQGRYGRMQGVQQMIEHNFLASLSLKSKMFPELR
jgi:hypothetical protein